MGSITRSHSFVSGEKPTESEWNVDIDQLFTLVNGQLDTNNVDTSSSDGVSVLNANRTITGTRTHSGTVTMADDIVVNVAALENGMLTIELERVVPEEKKPRLISVK